MRRHRGGDVAGGRGCCFSARLVGKPSVAAGAALVTCVPKFQGAVILTAP